jgi:hypothetical protein
MLARLGAGIKAISGGPLNFSDLAAMMGPSLTDPGRLLGTLTESVYASWESVTGNTNGAGFTENWRNEKLFPCLHAIADQPTQALQQRKLRDLLLAEEEELTTAIEVLRLPNEQAQAFLIDRSDKVDAPSSSASKREYMGLEVGLCLLNICALLDLSQRGFRIGAGELRTWLDLYGKAFEQVLKLRISLRTLHVVDSHKFSLETSQIAESACEPILSKMKTILLAMREEISNGRADADQFQALYNRLINIPQNEQTWTDRTACDNGSR